MPNKPFVDFYEIFEASPTANAETIEQLFRYLAKRLHPDVAVSGDVKKFTELIEAYHTLRDPETRAAYDIEFDRQKRQDTELMSEAKTADSDTAERHKLLSLFYAKRRRDMKNPGVAPTSLESLMGCPESVIQFHLWYFMQKAWIQREESGVLSITAAGVDRIDEMNMVYASSAVPRITEASSRLGQLASV